MNDCNKSSDTTIVKTEVSIDKLNLDKSNIKTNSTEKKQIYNKLDVLFNTNYMSLITLTFD